MLVDAFGPRRTFWGTDLTRMPCTYRECVSLFTEELPWLKGEDLEWVMGRGVCEWLGGRCCAGRYQLPDAPPPPELPPPPEKLPPPEERRRPSSPAAP